jgi:hypothetical protein
MVGRGGCEPGKGGDERRGDGECHRAGAADPSGRRIAVEYRATLFVGRGRPAFHRDRSSTDADERTMRRR